MIRTTILGCGFTGQAIARHCLRSTDAGDVVGTRRETTGLLQLEQCGIPGLLLGGPPTAAMIERLENTTHLISSVAPARSEPLDDPMLQLVSGLGLAGRLPRLRWIGYLSTIGVYGDHAGALVNEDTPCRSQQLRSIMRLEAETRWQQLGQDLGVPVCVLRLSGIYGPGRNALCEVTAGRARRVRKAGHVFNRVHVDDIAAFTAIAMERCQAGVFNVTDDEPAASGDVITHACELLQQDPPEWIDFDSASMSPMALSFWSEFKRCDNTRGKEVLGFRYRYPSYREGLSAELARMAESRE